MRLRTRRPPLRHHRERQNLQKKQKCLDDLLPPRLLLPAKPLQISPSSADRRSGRTPLLECADLATKSPAKTPLAPACKSHWASDRTRSPSSSIQRAGNRKQGRRESSCQSKGKGKQRGSLLADCLERAETECAEILAGLDQGSSACESTRHDNWIPADWLICCFLFFGQWMGMQLQPNQDQESRAQSRISFAVPLPLQHRHHQHPHQNRRSPPPQALLLP